MRFLRQQGRPLLGFVVSALVLILLVRTVNLAEVGRALAAADMRFVPIAIALHLLGVWARSVRWRLLLPPGSASTATLFRALVVGFTVNNLLPARLGEFARAYLLARWSGVAYGTTFASLVVERVLDGLALAVILLVALALVPTAPPYLLTVALAVGAVLCLVAGLLVASPWWAAAYGKHLSALARPIPPRAKAPVGRLVADFAQALRPVRAGHLLVPIAALSLLGWMCELALFYVLMAGFAIPASLPLAMLGGAAANFATLIPSSPGYVGTFDGVLVKVLTDVTSASVEQVTAYALAVHATLLIPIIALGTVIVWRANITFEQVTRSGTARVLTRGRVSEG